MSGISTTVQEILEPHAQKKFRRECLGHGTEPVDHDRHGKNADGTGDGINI